MKNLIAVLCLVAPLALSAAADARQRSSKELRVPSIAHGFIGGESHDTYKVYAKEGQRVVVRLAWQRESDNFSELSISDGEDFYNSEPLTDGQWSRDKRVWNGTIRKSGWLFLHVVAHPSAHYTLTVKRR